jgi:drug/metabolite transporter (DMT)-like permease
VPPLLLALTSGLAWGAADFLGGLSARRRPLLAVVLLSQLAGTAAVAALVLLRGTPPPATGVLLLAAAGGVSGAVGLAALYRGLAVGRMGLVAPTAALSGAIPVAWGLVRGEDPAALQLLGIVVAIGGVVLAARAPDPAGERTTRGLGLAALAAVTIGLVSVVLDEAGRHDPLYATLGVRVGALSLLLVAVLVRRPSLRVGARDGGRIALTGLLDNGANLAFAMAARGGGLLALNAVLGSLYPVTTVLLARLLLRERLSGVQAAGVLAALLGVSLIAAG